MTNLGKKMGIGELVRSYSIRIPMIQRDYVQGAPSATDVRTQFLAALEHALNPGGTQPNPLNLDFVYGSVHQETFEPLDGQQRLTTLFLLHWYLAWVDGAWEAFAETFSRDGKVRFSYEVRPSSGEFFDKLAAFRPGVKAVKCPAVELLIKDQPWYLRYYDRDPSIQSSLVMLTEIHGRFKSSSGLFARLLGSGESCITFQALDLKEFDLTDDLYIKMNARGKPLTPFEAFKGQFEEKIAEVCDGLQRELGGGQLPVSEFVSLRLDTIWTDLFWAYRDPATKTYDEALMNVLRVIALISRDPKSAAAIKELDSLTGSGAKSGTLLSGKARWVDRRFTEMLIALLERWSVAGGKLVPLLPDKRHFDEMDFFRRMIRGWDHLIVPELVQFAAYALFVRQHDGQPELPGDTFQQWMRVVHNLAVNSTLDRYSDLLLALRGLMELLPGYNSVLQHLAGLGISGRIAGFGAPAVEEEILKAGLILQHPAWLELLCQAEAHPYFDGQIGFLLSFAGITERWRSEKRLDWPSSVHEELQSRFRDYLEKASAMFGPAGLNESQEFRWTRALLAVGDFMLPMGRHWSFLVDSASQTFSWKRLLRGIGEHEAAKRPVLKALFDRLASGSPFPGQLDQVIADADGLPAWQQLFVKEPKLLQYCGVRAISWQSEQQIYLLERVRMSASHAELFTYYFFVAKIGKLTSGGALEPLKLVRYFDPAGIDEEPHIQALFNRGEKQVVFRIEWDWDEGKFVTEARNAALEADKGLREALLAEGFDLDDTCPWRADTMESLSASLKKLAKRLAELPNRK